ncbi:MAG: hypothetical protein E7Z80_00370 [Methanobrevibacter thaueri]|nr:hypothetical protein [Methanobrevibacter thaueri]
MQRNKWIESLLDDMFESQWSNDLIKEEFKRLTDINENNDLNSISELEPINQFSKSDFEDEEIQNKDFNKQLENIPKTKYQDHLIEHALYEIQESDFFNDYNISEDDLEVLIKQHLEEEKDFLDMVVKEAIATDDYFQEYIENQYQNMLEEQYYEHYENYNDFDDYVCQDNDDDFLYYETSDEKDIFDDLGDTSYMDQGIFKGANTDSFEEPYEYVYYEILNDDFYDEIPEEYGADMDLEMEEIPEPQDSLDELIKEKLFEEKFLDKIFVEIVKEDKYWDDLINEKLANDEKFNEKLIEEFDYINKKKRIF